MGIDDGRSLSCWVLAAEWQQGGMDGTVVIGRLGFGERDEETVGEEGRVFLEATPEAEAAVPGVYIKLCK